MNKRTALRVLGLTAVAWGALALGGCSREAKTSFQGVDVTGAEYAKDIPLRDVDGKQRSLKDFAGKVVVVFFGYTQCPDVCPTTMQELVEVKQQLGADGDRLQGIFVTLDPERDTNIRRPPAACACTSATAAARRCWAPTSRPCCRKSAPDPARAAANVTPVTLAAFSRAAMHHP
jgi:cytochrome oxidase Cu insertion factor (SCO1/SenC/PrrC family)